MILPRNQISKGKASHRHRILTGIFHRVSLNETFITACRNENRIGEGTIFTTIFRTTRTTIFGPIRATIFHLTPALSSLKSKPIQTPIVLSQAFPLNAHVANMSQISSVEAYNESRAFSAMYFHRALLWSSIFRIALPSVGYKFCRQCNLRG